MYSNNSERNQAKLDIEISNIKISSWMFTTVTVSLVAMIKSMLPTKHPCPTSSFLAQKYKKEKKLIWTLKSQCEFLLKNFRNLIGSYI